MTKLKIFQAGTSRRQTFFFGLLWDQSEEERQIHKLHLIVECVGGVPVSMAAGQER